MGIRHFNTAFVTLLFSAFIVGQEETTPEEPAPKIWRGKMANMLDDNFVLQSFQSVDGQKSATLRSPVAVHFASENAAFCWDAGICRLVYAWATEGEEFVKTEEKEKIATPFGRMKFLASGPGNFAATVGAFGSPQFFGLKIGDDGGPEFHYAVGRLAVRERISFSKNGEAMHQHFSIEGGGDSVMIAVPKAFAERAKTDKGKLKGNFLTLTATEAKSVTITFDLSESEE